MTACAKLTLEEARKQWPSKQHRVNLVVKRLEPLMEFHDEMRAVDIGCAQGSSLVALQNHGFEAHGVEPSDQARETGAILAKEFGVTLPLHKGTMEHIPFDDGYFDLVIAASVVEHVGDLQQSFREVHRVLRPGGIFWFSCASAMSPRQDEIRKFPLFGWYPQFLKERIMLWASENRPELIGHSEAPALHWMTPRKANRELTSAGFVQVWNRWELRHQDEYGGRLSPIFMTLAKDFAPVRIVGDIVIKGSSFAARKGQ